MNITITRTTSFARLDRIERYATRAQQRLLDRAFAELHRLISRDVYAAHRAMHRDTRCGGFVYTLEYVGKACWGLEWLQFRALIMGGAFGLRLARILRRAEALDAALETVSEEYGTRDGMSAADCAAWSDRQYAIACWEDRHGERWQGEW